MADWSLLPIDLLELIVGRFHNSFEIVLFRSVCSSWRSVVPSPRDSRFLVNKTYIPPFLHYLHTFRGKPRFGSDDKYCTLKKFPVYLVRFKTPFGDDYLLAGMCERNSGKPMLMSSPLACNGLSTPEGNIMLFNSLTTQIVFLCYQYQISLEVLIHFSWPPISEWANYYKVVEYLELNTEDCTDFRLLAEIEGELIIFSSLDMRWTNISVTPELCRDMVSFKGKFYVVDTSGWGHVFVIEPSYEVSEIPSVTRSTYKSSKEDLVKSGEELLLVQQFTPGESDDEECIYNRFPLEESHLEHMYTWFRVFRLDEEGGRRKWVEINDLNDRVIFLGYRINLCCSVQNLPGAKENCIVFIDSRNGIVNDSESILLFDLRTKRTSKAFSECKGYMGAFGANLESLVSCGVLALPNQSTSIYDLLSGSIWLPKSKSVEKKIRKL